MKNNLFSSQILENIYIYHFIMIKIKNKYSQPKEINNVNYLMRKGEIGNIASLGLDGQ